MTLHDAVTDYLHYLEHEQGASYMTCKGYQSQLRYLLRWLSQNGYSCPTLADFTTPMLRRFLYALSARGIRPRTIRGYFHPARGLGAFLVHVGALTENPAAHITLPKLDAAIRLEVTDADVAALFEACERQRTPRAVAMSRALVSVLAYGGLRRSEVCDLNVADVNLTDKSILVRSGKGSKSRKIFVCKDAVTALREWLAVREADCKHEYLFAYDRNRRLHHKGIQTLIETLKATAGLRGNEAIKPHGLRHWCATNLLRNGANLRDVQQFLGHSDLQTTCRYLHSSEEQLRAISELTALRPPSKPADDGKVIRLPQREPERRLRRITR
jgi:site-specific recombinase XerD